MSANKQHHLNFSPFSFFLTDSYTRLSDVVDQMFPPLEYTAKKSDFLSEYSTFNYWKEPIESINEEEDDLIKALSATKVGKTSSYYSKVPSPRA